MVSNNCLDFFSLGSYFILRLKLPTFYCGNVPSGVLQTRYLCCEVDLDYKLGRVCARAISSCKSTLTPTRHVRNRVCAIDGRRGVGV